jgi:small subunit ribosomal protein S6
MQRTYELMFIVRPDIAEEDLEKLVSTLESQITGAGGTVKNIERMGKRRLAYTVRKFRDGLYILFTLEGEGELVKEVERRLRVTEPVIKFITVRVDLEAKRLDKVRSIRASKVRRPAEPAPSTEPEAESGAEPAAVNA